MDPAALVDLVVIKFVALQLVLLLLMVCRLVGRCCVAGGFVQLALSRAGVFLGCMNKQRQKLEIQL